MGCGKYKDEHQEHLCVDCGRDSGNGTPGSCPLEDVCVYGSECHWIPKISEVKKMGCGKNGTGEHTGHYCYKCKHENNSACYDNCHAPGNCDWENKTVEQKVVGAATKGLDEILNKVIDDVAEELLKPSIASVVLDRVNLVSLNVNIWQGRKAMTPADMATNGIDVSKLPPTALATLGSKRIVDTAHIAPFNIIKREATKACQAVGIKFGNAGYAVPASKMDGLCKVLNGLKTTFHRQADQFAAGYETAVAEWIKQNPPEWEPIIKKSMDTKEHVRGALSFRFTALAIKPPKTDEDTGLDEEVTGLFPQLAKEIRQLARQTFDMSFNGKLNVTRRALRPLYAIRDKLTGLVFLDDTIGDVIIDMNMVLNRVPRKGVISGSLLNEISGLLCNQLVNIGRRKMVIDGFSGDLVEAPEEDEDLSAEQVTEQVVSKDPALVAINWDF